LKVVNLGDDSDTTGAVYGQIAGAYYGIGGIPSAWLEKPAKRDLIERLARELYARSGPGG
jgi:ADP-ribosyl-[dinitrogen reductase] hydrolase